jgi:signal transduction histidine kinase
VRPKTGSTFTSAIPALRVRNERPGRHPIVKLDYLVRLVAVPIASFTTLASLVTDAPDLLSALRRVDDVQTNPVVLGILVFYGLLWPHAAFGIATLSHDSKAAELRNLLGDCFALGLFVALSGFSPMLTIAFLTSINAASLSLGGVNLALRGLLMSATGALVAIAWLGFHPNLDANPLTNVLGSTAIIVFTSIFGFLSHVQTRRLLNARQEMLEQNVMIEQQKREVEEARRVAEEERRSAEEARQAAEETREAAEAANKAKSAFLANMSHELRTPLNAIIGYGELLQEEAEDAGHEELIPDLQKICTSGKHLLKLINNVLDLSKIEAGKMDLYVETFDLEQLVEEVAATAEALVAKNSNRFELRLPPDLGELKGDATKLKQVLLNVIGNAGKFTENGTISLEVRRENDYDGSWVVFRMTDTGIGMKPEQLAKLFQAFTQADAATTRKYGGTGLGLVLSRRFCQMMGGEIGVKSEFGKGTEFTVRLPSDVANAEGDATSIHRLDSRKLVDAAGKLRAEAERRKQETPGA